MNVKFDFYVLYNCIIIQKNLELCTFFRITNKFRIIVSKYFDKNKLVQLDDNLYEIYFG